MSMICQDKTHMKKETAGNEEIKRFYKILAYQKEEEVLMPGYI